MNEQKSTIALRLNLNDRVAFTLTEYGKRVYQEYWQKIGVPTSIIDKPASMPLWEVMQIFGPCLLIGRFETPFKNNEILFGEVRVTFGEAEGTRLPYTQQL